MRQQSKAHGFTIVEVLVALAILAIGILGVTILLPYAMEQGQRAAGLTFAANYSQEEFSRYRAKGFQSLYGRAGTWGGMQATSYQTLSQAAEAYRVYGFGDDIPIRLVKTEMLQFDRSAGLYKLSVSVPLVAGGNAAFVTYLARE